MPDSFQDRVLQSTLQKSIPNAIAELSVSLRADTGQHAQGSLDNQPDFELPNYYLFDKELIAESDPRVDEEFKKTNTPLTAGQFASHLLQLQQGPEIDLIWEDAVSFDDGLSAFESDDETQDA